MQMRLKMAKDCKQGVELLKKSNSSRGRIPQGVELLKGSNSSRGRQESTRPLLSTPSGNLRRLATPDKSIGARLGMWPYCHSLSNDFLVIEWEQNLKPKILLLTLVAVDYGFTCPPIFMSVCCCCSGRPEIAISQPFPV
jgi:hypothetical protein